MVWRGWEDYEPPKISGGTTAGERPAQREGLDQDTPDGPARDVSTTGDRRGAVQKPGGGGTGRPGPGKKGPARLTAHKTVFIDIERRQLLEGDLGKEAKKRRPNVVERLHSKREGLRYLFLLNEQDAGRISSLRRQVRFALNVRRPDGLEETIAHWTCDFDYLEGPPPPPVSGEPGSHNTFTPARRVIEDCKGFRTEMYQRSKKHFEAQYGIRIKET